NKSLQMAGRDIVPRKQRWASNEGSGPEPAVAASTGARTIGAGRGATRKRKGHSTLPRQPPPQQPPEQTSRRACGKGRTRAGPRAKGVPKHIDPAARWRIEMFGTK